MLDNMVEILEYLCLFAGIILVVEVIIALVTAPIKSRIEQKQIEDKMKEAKVKLDSLKKELEDTLKELIEEEKQKEDK